MAMPDWLNASRPHGNPPSGNLPRTLPRHPQAGRPQRCEPQLRYRRDADAEWDEIEGLHQRENQPRVRADDVHPEEQHEEEGGARQESEPAPPREVAWPGLAARWRR